MKIVSVVTTPNPDALKFTVDCELLKEGSRSFTSLSASEQDPIASKVFALGGVTSVFYMANFVTVNKKSDVDWGPLENAIIDVLRQSEAPEHAQSEAGEVADQVERKGPPYSEMSPAQKILAIDRCLDQEIRPGLAGDGGGVEIVSLEDDVLQIHYEGACGSCPSSASGTLTYIESILKSNIEENLRVVSV